MKRQKKQSRKHKHYKGRNKHHLVPKARGGNATPQNLLLIDIERHEYWHKLFKLMTLDEVIALLIRLKSMKKYSH